MNPLGLLLAIIALTSTIFYFRDMIRQSKPMKRLSDFTNHLKSQGYHIVGLQSKEVSLKELLVASIEVANRGGIKVKQIRESNDLKVFSILTVSYELLKFMAEGTEEGIRVGWNS